MDGRVLSAAPLMGWSVVSMQPRREQKIPAVTVAVARAAFPKGCLAMRIRDALGSVFADGTFADLFAVRGRSAVSPARLALVSVLQFTENLSDRQAADAVRGRLDWKYALGLELTDDGFDASVLSEFRSRPACEEAAGRMLELLLDRLAEKGLLAAGGRQRTDATCVLAAIRNLNRLELVTETMRAALEAVTVCAPGWLVALAPPPWYERYAQRAGDYRLPRTHTTRDAHAMTVGQDGYLLLEAVHRAGAPPWLRQIPAVQVLRRVWVQRYYRQEGVTTVATTTDVETTPAVHAELARRDLLPAEHYVDAGYVSVDQIIEARDRYGVDLVGPLPPDSGWQAYDPEAFDLTHFTIDWDNEQVICPRGKTSGNWRHALSRNGLPIIQVTFRKPDCDPCPDRAGCTRAQATARNMTFRPRAKFEEQHRVRAQQATDA